MFPFGPISMPDPNPPKEKVKRSVKSYCKKIDCEYSEIQEQSVNADGTLSEGESDISAHNRDGTKNRERPGPRGHCTGKKGEWSHEDPSLGSD